jgi:hypothetical protein
MPKILNTNTTVHHDASETENNLQTGAIIELKNNIAEQLLGFEQKQIQHNFK